MSDEAGTMSDTMSSPTGRCASGSTALCAQRDRMTMSDRQLDDAVNIFHVGSGSGRVRRRLERPTGSVR